MGHYHSLVLLDGFADTSPGWGGGGGVTLTGAL